MMQNLIITFLMASHPRLGANSPANVLSQELFKHIAEFAVTTNYANFKSTTTEDSEEEDRKYMYKRWRCEAKNNSRLAESHQKKNY